MIREKTPDAAFQLLPEWAEQEAVVLVWPDEQTDWAYILDEIRQTYVEFIEAIALGMRPCGSWRAIRRRHVRGWQVG